LYLFNFFTNFIFTVLLYLSSNIPNNYRQFIIKMFGGDGSKLGGGHMGAIVAVIVVIVLVLVFLPQLTYSAKALRTSVVSAISGKTPSNTSQFLIPDEDMQVSSGNTSKNAPYTTYPGTANNSMGMGITNGTINPESAELMQILGYGDSATWDEVLKTTELDPATFANHQDFVKDVRRFSSGANFTSVTDDNTNLAFTNFVGLRRPQQVDIGASARQQPDIDQSVLKRNMPLRWGYSAGDSTYLTAEQVGVPAGQYQYENNYEGNVQNAEQFVNY
jgi:hypothetical protein